MRTTSNTDAITRTATDAPAANTAAVVKELADANEQWIVDTISWSLSGTVAAVPKLTIKSNAVTLWQVEIPAVGVGHIVFQRGFPIIKGQELEVSLAAAGAAAISTLSITYR
jgi:hypothetical protein